MARRRQRPRRNASLRRSKEYREHMRIETGGKPANRKRVQLALRSLRYFAKANRTTKEPLQANITDLIADLLHLANATRGVNLKNVMFSSQNHFQSERPFGY